MRRLLTAGLFALLGASGSASALTPEASQLVEKAVKETEKSDGDVVLKSDYEAKHFSLVGGAVILNPFTLKSVDPDSNPATFDFQLQTGHTAANALFETGMRRRWAWDDWGAKGEAGVQLADLQALRDGAEAQLRAERGNPPALQAASTIGTLLSDVVLLEKAIDAVQREIAPEPCSGPLGNAGQSKCRISSLGGYITPDNYVVRLGFALDSGKPSGAASIAGAGDFYAEVGLGWDFVRMIYPTDSTPLKISIGPEFLGTVSNDPALNDFHHRTIVGLGMSMGIPFQKSGVAEVVVRAGWVHAEIPEFIGDTRLVEIENEVPAFRSHQGFGFDIEMNIPIGENLGYVFIRATTNHGFDPNPWGTIVGYTIPIGSFAKGLAK